MLEHWPKVGWMTNPYGYLFRVGQSRTRPRGSGSLVDRPDADERLVEPALAHAMDDLVGAERLVEASVHSYDWTLLEVADLIGVSIGTVQVHLEWVRPPPSGIGGDTDD